MTTTQQPDTLETLKSTLAERHAERLRAILKQAPPHELGYVLDELSIAEQAAVMRLLGDEHLSSLLATCNLDDAVEATASSLERQQNPLRRFLRMLGPGLVTGASDDDPSGIATYAVAGASFGFATLWTALLTFPLMAAVQYMCAKIGLTTGMGLAGVLRQHYSRWMLYPAVLALLVANTINAGADIGAIAAAINLLFGLPISSLVMPIALMILVVQIVGPYRLINRMLKWLTLALGAYVASAFFAHPDWGEVLRGTVIPTVSMDRSFLATLVAVLGTTISPYLFFWQANHYMEEQVAKGRIYLWQRRGASDAELRYAGWDVGIGMFLSNLVMYFVVLASAATRSQTGQPNITSAADAAAALRPIAGDGASFVLALGLIGTGFLAVPVLTGSAAYAAAETFSWRSGLGERLSRAKSFYALIVVSTVVGTLINFLGVNPIEALFWTAVINGLLAPPLLVLIMLVANNPAIMGRRKNGLWLNLLGWLATVLMFAAATGLVVFAGV
jgi:NRAMP (natural resistance-associated macrophage protein)-like metal ion transporter